MLRNVRPQRVVNTTVASDPQQLASFYFGGIVQNHFLPLSAWETGVASGGIGPLAVACHAVMALHDCPCWTVVLRFINFYGCFSVIEAQGGTWFRTPGPNCRRSRPPVSAAAPRPRERGGSKVMIRSRIAFRDPQRALRLGCRCWPAPAQSLLLRKRLHFGYRCRHLRRVLAHLPPGMTTPMLLP